MNIPDLRLPGFPLCQDRCRETTINRVIFVALSGNVRIISLVKTAFIINACICCTERSNDSDLTYGLGLKYNFTHRSVLCMEWVRYKNPGGSDADMASIGFSYHFARY